MVIFKFLQILWILQYSKVNQILTIFVVKGDTEPESEDENHELSGAYEAQDYQNLYNLKTHSKNSSEADNLAMATSASLMLFYLKINNYFGFNASRDSERELNEAEIYIGKLLYHFLEVYSYAWLTKNSFYPVKLMNDNYINVVIQQRCVMFYFFA